jgi:hypothetical protein
MTIWKETYELSFELAETVGVLFDYMIDYCKKKGIPLYEEKGLWSLVRKVRCIFREIEQVNSHTTLSQKISDEFLHDTKNRRRLDRTPIALIHIFG